nr:MAG: hypothetical protein DIU80_02805 [Chloroflexota bacterium]
MLGKALIAAGVVIALLGGVLLAALVTATQMAQSAYQPTVQHYAEVNAAAGNPLAFGAIAVGAALVLVGLALTLLRRTTR